MAKEKTWQDKLLPVMVVALIGASFALGMMWGKLQVYEKGGKVDKAQVEEAKDEAVIVSDELWSEMLASPAFEFGDEGAEVTLVEFTDYQCPFCERYSTDTMSDIVSEYVDTGKVKYIIRDLPLSFHANAEAAATAARCAGDQGRYKDMHAKLFENQGVWSEEVDPASEFKEYASQMGFNTREFSDCYDGEKYAEMVAADLALAAKAGASGTPTFFVNKTKLVGAQPYAAFEQVIEAALEE